MNKELLTAQLENKGFSGVQIEELSLCRPRKDANGDPNYERDRLLHTFKGRLRGCLANDPNNGMVPFLQQAIADLEPLSPETNIYYWECVANQERISGRSTVERILHIYPPSGA